MQSSSTIFFRFHSDFEFQSQKTQEQNNLFYFDTVKSCSSSLTIIPTVNVNIIESKHVAVSISVILMTFHRKLTNISHWNKQETEMKIEWSHHASCVSFDWLLHYQFRRVLPQANQREKDACLSLLQTSEFESWFSKWDASLSSYLSQRSDEKMNQLDEWFNLNDDNFSCVIYCAQRRWLIVSHDYIDFSSVEKKKIDTLNIWFTLSSFFLLRLTINILSLNVFNLEFKCCSEHQKITALASCNVRSQRSSCFKKILISRARSMHQ